MRYIITSITAFLMMVMCLVSCSQSDSGLDKNKAMRENVPYLDNLGAEARYNVQRAYDIADRIFPFIALLEGDEGEGHPYHDKSARWTVWFGSTVKPDGSRVKKNDAWIPRSEGIVYSYCHLFKHVFPFFQYFDKRKLSDEQIICTALFIYNVGGEQVTGYNNKGIKIGNSSSYLKAVGAGKDNEYCVNCLTGFRRSGNQRAGGLLKRHWVEGAAYLGILTADNILPLIPAQFYNTKNYGNYFWLNKRRRILEENGFYKLRYDETTIKTFLKMNTAKSGQKSVGSIIK